MDPTFDDDDFPASSFNPLADPPPPALEENIVSNRDQQHIAYENTTLEQELPSDQPPRLALLAPCCDIDKEIISLSNSSSPQIQITEAIKINDYIAYNISAFGNETKRRYSEFEALRTILEKTHQTSLVAPIPEKHGLSERKDDVKIIAKRKRMLQIFLNRLAAHPIVGRDHVFHQFIQGSMDWSDILAASGSAHFLKRVSGAGLGKLVERTLLKNHDPQFLSAEDYTFRFSHQITLSYRVAKRISRIYADSSAIEADLGQRYNSWSLLDSSQMSAGIEAIGGVFDSIAVLSQSLALELDEKVGDLLQEYSNYTKVVEKLLKYRHRKHGEWEAITESIASKQSNLEKWESSESEAQRISAVLMAEGSHRDSSARRHPQGILATINSFIDNDPELTRRNNISKTRDALTNLAEIERKAKGELLAINKEIQADLDRFQRDKVHDLREIFLAFAGGMKSYHVDCLKSWKGVQVV